jgi:light-regulated signal transduction histidine kinase (bacteriophytochrome)
MTNQRNRDAEFCGKVPLHQTNMIQPHGVLLIVAKENLNILQVSENINAILEKPASEVAGMPLSDYIPAEQTKLLQDRFAQPIEGKIPITFSFTAHGVLKKFLALVQAQPDYYILEIEASSGGTAEDSFISVYQELKFVIAAIEATATIEEAARLTVNELKRISGFDKVMVYQFDTDWNGTVIGEAMEPEMDSYFGLKFPASDIPKQAREMYRKNPYRFIPDVAYQPVRLYPVLNPVTGGFTDLTDSNLRSVAGVHLEYLRNMRVAASMSTRIVKDEQLWGLISCHHRTAKPLSYQMCSLFELLSNIISAKVASLEQRKEYLFKSEMHALYSKLVERVYNSPSLSEGLYEQQHELLKLLNADGVAVVLENEVQTFGTAPATSQVEDLVFWLQTNSVNKLYHSSNLPGVYEGADAYATDASGLLALPVQPERGAYILAFRPEAVRDVAWGGNPDEAITFEPDGKRYHPRNSFRMWKKTVQNNAIPWNKEEIEIAEQFRNFVVEYTLNKM